MANRQAPVVDVEQGALRGKWESKGDIAVFKGVPFAAPPVGRLRWRPPQPHPGWKGARSAVKPGPTAIQRAADLELFLDAILTGQGWGPMRVRSIKTAFKYVPKPKESEDCLYLSVRTPTLDEWAKLPVMVWIHGGDHQDGSGSEVYYQSNALASQGVVVVAINYRLGVMGNLAHPELMAESEHGVAGNYGTLDQIAALEWVRSNIGAFGGDPDNVTIFGESAGGESVAHMMTSPLARGLFHRAIPQSPANGGQMIHLDRPFAHLASGAELATRFAATLGVTGPDQLPRLRAMSAAQLYEVARADRELGNHYPVIDGHVLPESPLAAFAAGRQAPVPLMIGSNADEGTLLRPLLGSPLVDLRHQPLPDNKMQPEMAEVFGDDLPRLLELYPGLDRRNPKAEDDFMGDHMFGARVYHYASHHRAAGHPTYLYFFSRVPKNPKQTAGAYHAAEIPFVHGSTVPIFPMTAADKALSAEMITYWTDFAKSGDPNGEGDGRAATVGHPTFPQFDPADPHWLRFDHSIKVEPVSRREQYDIFNARTNRLIAQMTAPSVIE